MTRVSISVHDSLLGDVDVDQDDRVTFWSEDRQRRVIQELLSEAITKINSAYGLTTTKDSQ